MYHHSSVVIFKRKGLGASWATFCIKTGCSLSIFLGLTLQTFSSPVAFRVLWDCSFVRGSLFTSQIVPTLVSVWIIGCKWGKYSLEYSWYIPGAQLTGSSTLVRQRGCLMYRRMIKRRGTTRVGLRYGGTSESSGE